MNDEPIENFCTLYKDVKRYLQQEPQFAGRIHPYDRGNLFNIINIILGENAGHDSQHKTKEITEYLKIDVRTPKKQEIDFCKSVSGSIKSNITLREIGDMEWIILGACTLVGSYFCLQYVQEHQSKGQSAIRGQEQQPQLQEYQDKPRNFILFLVVPYTGSPLAKPMNGMISPSILKELIDISSFFYYSDRDFSDIEANLDRIPEDNNLERDTSGEVYVRIQLYSVPDLHNVSTRYELKSKLDEYQNTTCAIKEYFRLSNRSGLDKFIRV